MFLLTVVPGDLYAAAFVDVFDTLEEAEAALQEVRSSGMFKEIRAESIEAHDQSYYWHEFYPVDLSEFSDEIPF